MGPRLVNSRETERHGDGKRRSEIKTATELLMNRIETLTSLLKSARALLEKRLSMWAEREQRQPCTPVLLAHTTQFKKEPSGNESGGMKVY